MTTLTFSQIAVLDTVVPDLRCLRMAFEQRRCEYAVAALIASKAWAAFDEAVDDEQPADEVNRLGDIAETADALKAQAYRDLDAVKAAMIASEQ